MQFERENTNKVTLPQVKIGDHEDITKEAVLVTLRRAISRCASLQTHDGQWPSDIAGPLFIPPVWVILDLKLR